jgi:hypothetical protein
MHEINAIDELPSLPKLAVIINCGTKWLTTLALASTLRRTDFPVLIVDCESKDASKQHFSEVSARQGWQFHWLELPLQRHGLTLDAIFREARAEAILLVDSDLEIRDGRVVAAMTTALDGDRQAYGAGFLHAAGWLGEQHGLPEHVGWYAERMWIPLVLLRTDAVRRALERALSFAQRRSFSAFPAHPRLSRWLAYRYWLPGIRELGFRAAASDGAAGGFGGRSPKPAFVEFDTGALLHDWLRGRGYRYLQLDNSLWGDVTHYHGVTRAGLSALLQRLTRASGLLGGRNETAERTVISEVRQRLLEGYGIGAGA